MPDLRLEIQNYLWSKFFADLDSIVQGLDAFLNAEPVEDAIEATVGEYYEQICVIVSEIELRATTFGYPQVGQEDLQRLCHAIANIHIELRLQRDAICQASYKNVSQRRYYELIMFARKKLVECRNRIRAALDQMTNTLASRSDAAKQEQEDLRDESPAEAT